MKPKRFQFLEKDVLRIAYNWLTPYRGDQLRKLGMGDSHMFKFEPAAMSNNLSMRENNGVVIRALSGEIGERGVWEDIQPWVIHEDSIQLGRHIPPTKTIVCLGEGVAFEADVFQTRVANELVKSVAEEEGNRALLRLSPEEKIALKSPMTPQGVEAGMELDIEDQKDLLWIRL